DRCRAWVDRIVVDPSRLPLPAWIQLRVPSCCRRSAIDLLWSPTNVGPLRCARQLATIHDASPLAHPEWFPRSFALYYRWLWPRLGRRVARIITDSDFSRRELIDHGVAGIDSIDVIPCGIDDHWQPRPLPSSLEGHGVSDGVLVLGAGNPRKNVGRALDAWRRLDAALRRRHPLIVVGDPSTLFRSSERTEEGVVSIRELDDDGLAALYTHARVLLYPSLYEGFGLPPLEALACGTPSIVSDGSSLREVCGEAVRYCDPSDVDSISSALSDELTRPKRVSETAAGLREHYSWSRSAAKLAATIEAVHAEGENPS
ncbi:MAG: glycosyltransferase family 4 protein, partial [Planctomycetes bacterium]|nr:glycosyltransferase family 4 protein [Planctomycetota bacterium]